MFNSLIGVVCVFLGAYCKDLGDKIAHERIGTNLTIIREDYFAYDLLGLLYILGGIMVFTASLGGVV